MDDDMAKTGKWIECSKKAPCKVCGRTDWCGRSIDPDTGKTYHRCMSSGADSPPGMRLVKEHPDGGRTYTDGSPDVAGRIGPGGSSGPAGGDASVSREMLERLASDYVQNIDAAQAIVVARNLGVPVASLAAVRMGWNPAKKALTFPESAGGGGIVGIPHRYGQPEAVGAEGEEKRSPKGHHRGITVPVDFRDTTGIVLVVEGPTDVAAAHALGIPAVGRPSNTGGVTDLAIALADREVIVLGEFDPKPSGDWPGRDGARAVALGLANRWGKPVRWSMPPDRAKDLRRWVQATLPGISDDGRFTAPPEAVESARNRLMLTVREMAKVVSPETGDADDTRPVIANATVEVDSDGKTKFLYVPLPAIVSTIARHTDGWPRRVSGIPFAVAGGPTDEDEVFLPDEGMIRMLDDTDHLFAWIHEWGAPFWTNKVCHDKATNHLRTAVSKAELSAQLSVRANPNYVSVETLPHYPAVDGAFYLPTRLPESDGSALAEFASRLNARSEIDRSLLIAALLTPGWGGPTGKRPIFLITSERGVGVGKAQPLNAPVLTPSGWRPIGDLRPGDRVNTPDGGSSVVVGVYPQGSRPIYRVHFSDGSFAECCDDHLWHTQTANERKNAARSCALQWAGRVRSTRQIRESLLHRGRIRNHTIPMTSPVEMDARFVTLDPYLVGVLIGDGNLSHRSTVGLSTSDDQILASISALLPRGMKAMRQGQSKYDYRFTSARGNCGGRPNPLLEKMRGYGLCGIKSVDKFIPRDYLFNSTSVRLAVLQGLMDTDGTVGRKNGHISFTTISPRLADDVVFLVQSLGGVARRKTRTTAYTYRGERRAGQVSHLLSITLPSSIPPFRLARKAALVIPRTKYPPRRFIDRVEQVGTSHAVCISIDHPQGLYLTKDCIVTHNTTTARMISSVWGRDIALRPDDEWQKIQTAIVSPAAVGRRIVLLDDARGSLKIPALESALTADEFQGHRLYVGHYTVPNRKTIFITSGDPSLGHDLADRAVPIYIGANMHSSDHDEWWSDFIANRRAALIADIMALLAGPAKCEIDPDLQTRWRIWQLAILSRFENGNELAEAIAANQRDLDSDREDAEELAMGISVMAARNGIDISTQRFTISVNDLHAEMVRLGVSRPKSTAGGFSKWVNRIRKNFACLGPLEPYGSRRLGRRWMWAPPGASNRTAHLQFTDSTGLALLTFDGGDTSSEARKRPRAEDDLPI